MLTGYQFAGECPYCERPVDFYVKPCMPRVFQMNCPYYDCLLVFVVQDDHTTWKLGEVTGDEEEEFHAGSFPWETCINCGQPFYACTHSRLCYVCRGEITKQVKHGTGDPQLLESIRSALLQVVT